MKAVFYCYNFFYYYQSMVKPIINIFTPPGFQKYSEKSTNGEHFNFCALIGLF